MALFNSVKIAGTGSFAPARIVSNEELAQHSPTSVEWVIENLGIRERRVAGPDEYTSDLAANAARQAIEAAGVTPNDIDLIVLATATPDRRAPSTACLVQEKLGISNRCPAFDLHAVCSGFLYAMTVAAQFLEANTYHRVLVIGADTFSKITDWSRRDCVFFGDGAGAVVLERTTNPRALFSCELYADGEGKNNFTVYPDDSYFTMNGKAVYETGSTVLPQAIRAVLEKNGMCIDDVSHIIPHQPSQRLLKKTAEDLGIPFSRIKTNMDRHANTAGATVPLLLDQVNRSGALKSGDLVVFAAVGAGWTWGAAIYRWL